MQKGRRKKIRYIQKMPLVAQFSPRGRPGRPEEIELKIDEYEAIKLNDLQGYHQDEGALAMGISRPSFGRILRRGRKVIADALVNGKIIRIRTGDVQVGVRQRNFQQKDPHGVGPLPLKLQLREESIRRKIYKYSSKRDLGKQTKTRNKS